MLELAGISVVDGERHPAEEALLVSVADRIAASPERVEECYAFAERARGLVLDGQALVAAADGGS